MVLMTSCSSRLSPEPDADEFNAAIDLIINGLMVGTLPR